MDSNSSYSLRRASGILIPSVMVVMRQPGPVTPLAHFVDTTGDVDAELAEGVEEGVVKLTDGLSLGHITSLRHAIGRRG